MCCPVTQRESPVREQRGFAGVLAGQVARRCHTLAFKVWFPRGPVSICVPKLLTLGSGEALGRTITLAKSATPIPEMFLKHLSAFTAIVMLVAIHASVSLAKDEGKDEGKGGGKSTKGRHVVVPCVAKIDDLVCTDDPDCKWDAKKSRCNKTHEAKDPCSLHDSEFYCEANKCHWHRLASKCSTKPSPDY